MRENTEFDFRENMWWTYYVKKCFNFKLIISIFLFTVEQACSSGFHSVSSNSQSPIIQNDKKSSDLKEQKTQFDSILMTIEKENTAVLERLTSLQASRNKIESNIQQKSPSHSNNEVEIVEIENQASLLQPIDSCVAMQAQLNRYIRR